jgi:hypothetical protein
MPVTSRRGGHRARRTRPGPARRMAGMRAPRGTTSNRRLDVIAAPSRVARPRLLPVAPPAPLMSSPGIRLPSPLRARRIIAGCPGCAQGGYPRDWIELPAAIHESPGAVDNLWTAIVCRGPGSGIRARVGAPRWRTPLRRRATPAPDVSVMAGVSPDRPGSGLTAPPLGATSRGRAARATPARPVAVSRRSPTSPGVAGPASLLRAAPNTGPPEAPRHPESARAAGRPIRPP